MEKTDASDFLTSKNWSDQLNLFLTTEGLGHDMKDFGSARIAKVKCSPIQYIWNNAFIFAFVSFQWEGWVWRVLREFGEFGEFGKFGEFGECRVDRFIHIKYFFSAWNGLPYHLLTYLRDSPNRLPMTRQTRPHSPSHLPSTRQTRQHLPKAIFEKNVTRLDKFARVMGESREFGVSGHCLFKVQN